MKKYVVGTDLTTVINDINRRLWYVEMTVRLMDFGVFVAIAYYAYRWWVGLSPS